MREENKGEKDKGIDGERSYFLGTLLCEREYAFYRLTQ